MEAKFFSEIEKKMDVKTIKDFEKEVRTKIYNELETLRKKAFGIGGVNLGNLQFNSSGFFTGNWAASGQ